MLSYLKIKNFAIIESLEWELSPGLTVLSGETGAGKSIVLAAVNLLLGQRAASDLVRRDTEEAQVEALFEAGPGDVLDELLAEEGLDGLEEGELIIRRRVSLKGKNRVQVAGSLATLALLNKLGPHLVSVCGQHDNQALLRPEEHLSLLDAHAGLEEDAAAVAQAVDEVQGLDREIARLQEAAARREGRRELLNRAVSEIEAAALDRDEEAELKKERELLKNAEAILHLAAEAHQGLYGADGAILERLGAVRDQLAELAAMDNTAAELSGRVEELYYLAEDAASELRSYQSGLNFEASRRDQVESRLLEISRVVRKYGGGLEAALEYLRQAREDLDTLENSAEHLAGLGKEREKALERALDLAGKLSARRRQAAEGFAREAEAELAQLAMEAGRIQFRLGPPGAGTVETPQGPLGRRGLETAELFIAPNPGEGFRRLTRIASGGELSRILLAVKGLAAVSGNAPTLIFDEVDAGVGGATGSAVGRKLARLAKSSQVICITHLPQIAVWADQHLSVRKKLVNGRTVTELAPLDQAERILETARMLAGDGNQETAKKHAEQLLREAVAEKQGRP